MISFSGIKTSVAVVIPTYNRASTLARAVASCQRQTRRVDEIVIVDDGSSDGTAVLVEGLAGADTRIRYLRLPENRGAQAARIEGIVASGSEWVVLLDSDDELLQDSIQVRLDAVTRCGFEPGIVFGDLIESRAGKRTVRQFERMSGHVFPRICRTLSTPWCGTQMVRRKCFEATGYPSPDLPALQGVDMALTIGKIFPVLHCGRPVVVWNESSDQITSDRARFVRAYRLMVDKYAKDIRRHHGMTGLFFWRVCVLQKKVNYEYNRTDAVYPEWRRKLLRLANALLARFVGLYIR